MTYCLKVFVPLSAVSEPELVPGVLEVLSELAPQYELTVVHGTEEAAEAAHELARRYPQVRAAAHRFPAFLAAAMAPRAAGDLVLSADRLADVRSRALARLSRERGQALVERVDHGRRRFNPHAQPNRAGEHAQPLTFVGI